MPILYSLAANAWRYGERR